MGDVEKFPVEDEDLDLIESALFFMEVTSADAPRHSLSSLRERISAYQKGWSEGTSPLKLVSPGGRTFNLRVDDDRAELISILNADRTNK